MGSAWECIGDPRETREYHIRIFLIPAGIIAGSIWEVFWLLSFWGFPGQGPGAAIASGMGWYSLSGVTIGRLGGAELGSIAFMSNLMREIFSFVLIPILAEKLNFYSCIAPGGSDQRRHYPCR